MAGQQLGSRGETPAQRIRRLFRETPTRLSAGAGKICRNNSLNESSAESSLHESLDINTRVIFADNHLHHEKVEKLCRGISD